MICTGNRNRSPLAEAALREATAGLPVEVSSVGLLDLGNVPVLDETLEVARRIGLDLTEHRARCLASIDVSEADLVLGLEWEHVAAAVVDHRSPPARSFTLLELVELLEGVPDPEVEDLEERARLLIAAAHGRKRSQRGSPMGASIPDPFGRPLPAFVQMAETVRGAAHQLAHQLFAINRDP